MRHWHGLGATGTPGPVRRRAAVHGNPGPGAAAIGPGEEADGDSSLTGRRLLPPGLWQPGRKSRDQHLSSPLSRTRIHETFSPGLPSLVMLGSSQLPRQPIHQLSDPHGAGQINAKVNLDNLVHRRECEESHLTCCKNRAQTSLSRAPGMQLYPTWGVVRYHSIQPVEIPRKMMIGKGRWGNEEREEGGWDRTKESG
eukprot:753972-Hanusia_phi.AAC.10